MELRYNQIMDFIRCPLLYKFKHVMKIDKKDQEASLYQSALYSVVMYYYYNLMNGTVLSKDKIRNKWYKMWNTDQRSVEDILFKHNGGKRLTNYNLNGIKSLELFYENEMKKTFTPIVVNTEVSLKFGDYIYTDALDLVRETKIEDKPIIEVVRISSAAHAHRRIMINHDFKTAFQTLAFRHYFETEEDRSIIYDLKLGKEHIIKISDDEFKRIEAIVVGIGDSIAKERFYPIIGQQCRYCPYIGVCDKYKF